jgi:hypothetical protein
MPGFIKPAYSQAIYAMSVKTSIIDFISIPSTSALQKEPPVFCLASLLLEWRVDVCAESLLFVVVESWSLCGLRYHSIHPSFWRRWMNTWILNFSRKFSSVFWSHDVVVIRAINFDPWLQEVN